VEDFTMPPRIKIRGIYSTALTRLFLDQGYAIADPSAAICERFGIRANQWTPHITILAKKDLQGIELAGEPEMLTATLNILQGSLPDAAMLYLDCTDTFDNLLNAVIEFPAASKQRLDEIRSTVCPTLQKHHRFRIIDEQRLEDLERVLEKHPERQSALELQSFREMILFPLEKGGVFKLQHIRPAGKPMRPREGLISKIEESSIQFKRTFSAGRYDGLDLPIERGDYGVTEITEGDWFIKHSYFSREQNLKGEYYNINTPVELYPYGARYLDLEIDVVKRAGEQPLLIDREKLFMLLNEGRIGRALQTKALEVAEELMRSLR
jgi:hypothetical protein